MVVKILSCDAL